MTATTSASKAICAEKTTAEIIEVMQLQLLIAVFQVNHGDKIAAVILFGRNIANSVQYHY